MDLRAGENTGQTGLHCAAIGGHLGIIKLLLKHGAPLEARNVYGGTVLGQATWCVMNGDGSVDYVPIIETLLAAGATVEEADYPTRNKRVDQVLRRHRHVIKQLRRTHMATKQRKGAKSAKRKTTRAAEPQVAETPQAAPKLTPALEAHDLPQHFGDSPAGLCG